MPLKPTPGALLALVVQPALFVRPVLAAAVPSSQRLSVLKGEVVWPILCGAAGILAFLLFHATTRLIRAAVRRSSRRKSDASSPTSAENFVEDARRLHIDSQIARETFQLLASLAPAGSLTGTGDDLRGALGLSDRQIASLLSALPELCSRSRTQANAASILSVYDLLHHIESCPKSASGQYYSRTSAAIPAPAASPLADLKNASPRDSRFRTRAHFSGVKRRASDYPGPYRRATDRRSDESYDGPLRRASDRQDASIVVADQRTADRRSSERRTSASQETSEAARQHRAVSADLSLLNHDPGPRPKRPGIEPKREIIPADAKRRALIPAVPVQNP